jgi:hypothetical protein
MAAFGIPSPAFPDLEIAGTPEAKCDVERGVTNLARTMRDLEDHGISWAESVKRAETWLGPGSTRPRSMSKSGQYRWPGCGHSTRLSCPIDACLNHGNSENGTKSSSESSASQNPWGDTFVTSGAEVFGPGGSDLLFMSSNQESCEFQLAGIQAVILRYRSGNLLPGKSSDSLLSKRPARTER